MDAIRKFQKENVLNPNGITEKNMYAKLIEKIKELDQVDIKK
jgi:hypothetical protein